MTTPGGSAATTRPIHGRSAARRTWQLGTTPWLSDVPHRRAPHARVIIDNDFSGDPDDLFQVVHHLLSPSVDIRAVVASHLAPHDPFDPGPNTATNAENVLHALFDLMGLTSHDVIVRGAEAALTDARTPVASPAVQTILEEAHREDGAGRLFYVAGGGLTDLASAYLLDPTIAGRLTLIWIGGEEHTGLADPPPGASQVEYNLNIDLLAGQVIFASGIPIWQVPRNVYRQCLVSDAELRARVAPEGELGAYLYQALRTVIERVAEHEGAAAETYALGDSPLVLLTALQSLFQADSSSSDYVVRPTPHLDGQGSYVDVDGARPMRVYTRVDTRLMFEDMFLKLHSFAGWQSAS